MDNLQRNVAKNMGGMLRFAYCFASDITVFPNATNKIVNSPILLADGATFYYGYATQGKNSFKENHNIDGQGTKYKISFEAFIPEMSSARSLTVDELNESRLVVFAVDNTKKIVIMGDPSNPCRCSADLDSGKSFPEFKGHKATFYWENRLKCNFYTASEITPPPPGGG